MPIQSRQTATTNSSTSSPGQPRAPIALRRQSLTLAIAGALALSLSPTAQAQVFPATIALSSLNGANGLRLDGVAEFDASGFAVSGAGDVNGDGIDDLLIGAPLHFLSGGRPGNSYVVFGKSTAFAATLPLSSLDGTTGFRLDGTGATDRSGSAVSAAGDINGDGIDDLLIGANGADPNGNRSGSSYVVFGKSTAFAATLPLSSLNGATGFRLDGAAGDFSGSAVSAAGDVNGDGIDDLLVGAPGADPNGDTSGSSYIVFGKSSAFAATLPLSTLDGATGFRLDGVAADDVSGGAVSGAGDVNGDGIDDLLIGARRADPNGNDSGSSYVVFGKSSGFAATFELSTLDGANGFRLDGAAAYDRSGIAVSAAGDVNGDGIDDLLIGADQADPNGGNSGSSYVVFGKSSAFAATLPLSTLDGTTGFRLDGVATSDYSGRALSAAGDVNGDGIDDLLIGAYRAEPNGSFSGSSYVIFGKSTAFDATLNLSSLDGTTGFRLEGLAAFDRSGFAVSAAGDVNGDGIDDLLTGAFGADPNGNYSGSSYLVFGSDTPIITNYSYTYYNSAEPGWGFNALHQGDLLFGTWYTYAEDGQTMFLTVEATLQLDDSFAGPVYRMSGTPLELINGSQAFTAVTKVGDATMTFDSAGSLALTYSVAGVSQSKSLQRFGFDPAAPTCRGTIASRVNARNFSDLWWNPSEAGWGLTLSHQGDLIFALWYTYGEGGRDQWISASNLFKQPDGTFAGALQRPESGVPLAQIAGAATTFPVPEIGSARLSFSDGENGSYTYTVNGVTQTKAIERFVAVGADQPKPICE